MTDGFALWVDNSRELDWGTLRLDRQSLTLVTSDGSAVVDVEPSSTTHVDVYVREDWLCAVGAMGRDVIVGRRRPTSLHASGDLRRAPGGDGAAFGRHSARFHDRPGHDQCVLSWELGVALVDPEIGVVWAHEHGDANQRVMGVSAETVDLRGTYQTLSVSLSDGSPAVREFRAPPEDGGEALAEWMRGIGG